MQDIPSQAPTIAGPDPLKTFATLIDRLVLNMSLIGIPTLLVAISRATLIGWRWGASEQVAAWGIIVLLLFFRRDWSFRRRTYGFLICLMVYAGAGVMINDTPTFRLDHFPYGGNKRSGLGREGVRFAIDDMTRIKMVVINHN